MNMTKSKKLFDDEALAIYLKQLQKEMKEVPEDHRQGKVAFMQRLFGVLKSHGKI